MIDIDFDGLVWIGAAMAMVVILLIVVPVGCIWNVRPASHWKNEAVEAGHAHYYIDENNKRQWEWLPPCAPAESEAADE